MIEALIGGSLIGLAAVWLLLATGRIAGISGIAASALKNPVENRWALLFIAGLGIGGFAGTLAVDVRTATDFSAVTPELVLGGLLVGVGTRLGSGCTSGHGVCGMARLSGRSIVATCVFVAIGMLTATLVYA